MINNYASLRDKSVQSFEESKIIISWIAYFLPWRHDFLRIVFTEFCTKNYLKEVFKIVCQSRFEYGEEWWFPLLSYTSSKIWFILVTTSAYSRKEAFTIERVPHAPEKLLWQFYTILRGAKLVNLKKA